MRKLVELRRKRQSFDAFQVCLDLIEDDLSDQSPEQQSSEEEYARPTTNSSFNTVVPGTRSGMNNKDSLRNR